MNVLEIDKLSKTFRSRAKTVEAVREVSLQVREGEVLAFLGPNGAGKTTTIKLVAALIRPDSGSVRVLGKDPHRDRLALQQIGAVLEGNRNVYWRLDPEENVEYFGVLKGLRPRVARARAAELVERFGLGDKRGVVAQKLSRGMQQQIALAVALVHEPKLLLLDEPTLGLDVTAAERIKQVIREVVRRGQSVVLSTHQLALAQEIAQRVAIIHQGRIVTEEATAELLRRYSMEAFRIELETPVDGARAELLAGLGAAVEGTAVRYTGPVQDLYRVFDLLRPAVIVRVEKVEASLTDVFLRLTDQENLLAPKQEPLFAEVASHV